MISFNELLTSWEAWAILGIALIVIDIFVDGTGNVLAAGAACFIVSAINGISVLGGVKIIESWHVAAIVYVLALVVSVFLVRWLRPKKAGPDINEY